MAEHKAALERLLGDDALAAEQKLFGKTAKQPPAAAQESPGMPGGAAHGRVSRAKVALRTRLRRRGIHRTLQRRITNRMRDQPDEIVALDPRHPLLSRPERPAKPEFDGAAYGQHAALGAEHETDAQAHDADAEAFRLHGGALQSAQSWREKHGRPSGAFVSVSSPCGPLPANGRPVDEHGRLLVESLDQPDHIAGHAQGRGKDAVTLADGPRTIGDRLAGRLTIASICVSSGSCDKPVMRRNGGVSAAALAGSRASTIT